MSEHAEDVRKQVKVYIGVFIALSVLTVVTVLVAGLDVSVPVGLLIGLLIALVKGSLVAFFFMHLSHEKKLIYGTLVLTVFFFLVLIFVPIFALTGSFESPEHLYDFEAPTSVHEH